MKPLHVIFALTIWLCASEASNAQEPQPSFTLSIRASHFVSWEGVSFETVKVDSVVKVELSFTNISNREIEYVQTHQAEDYAISVTREDGGVVQKTQKFEALQDILAGKTNKVLRGSTRISSLGPGQTGYDYILVSDFYDMRKPGRYVVQIGRGAVKSNAIVITVTE